MKLGFTILILFLISCTNSIKTNKQEKDNCDSIDFEKIENSKDYREYSEFILKNPKSKYVNEALKIYGKKREAYLESIGMPVFDCFRNCANIQIRPNQEIEFEYELIKLESLHDSLLAFLINKNDAYNRPEKEVIDNSNGKLMLVSKGRVELEYVFDSCQVLPSVVEEIKKSIESYKDFLSNDWYSKNLSELSFSKKAKIDSIMRFRLEIYGWDKERILSPSPPTNETILNE